MIDFKNFVGQKVIVRGQASGVHFGTLEHVEGQTVIVKNHRRLWYWSGAASLTQLSQDGVKYPKSCKFSVVAATPILISDMIEIIVCTEKAILNIEEVPEWKI